MGKKKNIVSVRAKKGSKPCLVKRAGHEEEFDGRKLYASAYAACLNAHLSEKESERIASKVLAEVEKELQNQKVCIASSHLAILVHNSLKKHNADAAFLYETHLDLS